ncbi:ferritin family protein [Spirochaeta isovalerica]|uniref:Rubrerythrin/NAD-dependent dihydropyrimidine dehydrogenase PreA subunit n=1 Tax=Spirochaeta isovalerica TaxID=150 RepID=A0A841RBU5_9SPIO|nr:ferritin family protein [Spirochaeta isovalerica]MBB6481166.1 rubrerythrin/NAD-dependent dihydropyrimidine dehydrogenase PreA subunit [Spirochaeta isovalerica]
MHAVRNIRLCTKDCLCLYVCPTGATDTETGQIDAQKCLSGCRLCVDACPSHAISLVPEEYPAQQETSGDVKKALGILSKSKTEQEIAAYEIEEAAETPRAKQLAKAIGMSNRIMAEDLLREAGFMLPQSGEVLKLLNSLVESETSEDFPAAAAEKLIQKLRKINASMKEKTMSKTTDNLLEAFAGEAQANRKYLAFSRKAEQEGHLNAAKLFRAAADAETIHALKHFEVAGKIGSTIENLKSGVEGETHEYKEMYPPFVEQAEAEGNNAAVRTFTFAMKAEEVHAGLYQEAMDTLDNQEEVFYYLCPVCGNIEKVVPGKCPICGVSGEKFIKY